MIFVTVLPGLSEFKQPTVILTSLYNSEEASHRTSFTSKVIILSDCKIFSEYFQNLIEFAYGVSVSPMPKILFAHSQPQADFMCD